MSETEWRTLMQAARALGISLSRAERYASSLPVEDYHISELPNGTRIRQVRLTALRAVYQAQRSRRSERQDGQVLTYPTEPDQEPADPVVDAQIVLYQELLAERELLLTERELLLAEREQRLQNQAAQLARLESILNYLSAPAQAALAPPSFIRAKPRHRTDGSYPKPGESETPSLEATQEDQGGEVPIMEVAGLQPLPVLTEPIVPASEPVFSEPIAEDPIPKANPIKNVTTKASSPSLEEQLLLSPPQEIEIPRKEIGKNGIAAAQWNGFTMIEDETFLEELPEPEPEPEEDQVLEEIEAVSPKKKKQNWLLSLLDES